MMITTLLCGVCRPFGLTPSKANFASPQSKTSGEVANGQVGGPPPDVLRKELENELRSDSKDIRSYAWYHGRMPRDIAEDLMRRDGDFLIRESITNIGDYVLTCKYKSAYYHFKINKMTVQKSASYATVQYCLEDEYFESLSALVYYHVGKKKPVSKNTGVMLGQPVNRDIPISYSEVKYASLKRQPKAKSPGGSSIKMWNNNNNTPTGKEIGSPRINSPNSLSSSPSSSASSIDYHDKMGLGPRTPSPQQQMNSAYSVPRNTTGSINYRNTSDPLPHLPAKSPGAVILEEMKIPNSYTPNGSRNQPGTPTHINTSRNGYASIGVSPRHLAHSAGLHTPPPSSPSYKNGSKPHPFPLTLFEEGPSPQVETIRRSHVTRLRSSGSQDTQVCIVSPNVNRPVSQVDMNVESHGKHVSRSGSDPLLSPTRTRSGNDPSSPRPYNANNNNSAFAFQTPPQKTVGQTKLLVDTPKAKNVPPKPSRVPSFRAPVIKGAAGQKSAGNNALSNRMGSVKNSVALLADKHMTPPTINEVSESQTASPNPSVSMRTKPPSASRSRKMAQKRKRASCFKPMQYQCTMLTAENPPLESNAIKEMKTLLLSVDPFKLARHMTVIDCKVCRIMEADLERLFFPHASQLRRDIVERYQCTAFWVAICVIKCASGAKERVEMLNMFIQVANELVHSMGNVFGFSAIMHGLTCPQIASLETSWDSLRQRFTNNAVTFEKKLRPLLRYLDEGKGQIRVLATCIPHIMPMVRLLENPEPGVPHATLGESISKKSASFGSLLDRTSPTAPTGKEDSASLHSTGRDTVKVDWWENHPNESFDSLLSHLNSGRQLVEHLEEIKKNANSKLVDFKELPKVREMFTTDFQMRFLFGYRGAESPRQDRYQKFDRIITAMLRHVVD